MRKSSENHGSKCGKVAEKDGGEYLLRAYITKGLFYRSLVGVGEKGFSFVQGCACFGGNNDYRAVKSEFFLFRSFVYNAVQCGCDCIRAVVNTVDVEKSVGGDFGCHCNFFKEGVNVVSVFFCADFYASFTKFFRGRLG